jgi:hypothetical protein
MAEMIVTERRPEVFEPFRIDRFPKTIYRRPETEPEVASHAG